MVPKTLIAVQFYIKYYLITESVRFFSGAIKIIYNFRKQYLILNMENVGEKYILKKPRNSNNRTINKKLLKAFQSKLQMMKQAKR